MSLHMCANTYQFLDFLYQALNAVHNSIITPETRSNDDNVHPSNPWCKVLFNVLVRIPVRGELKQRQNNQLRVVRLDCSSCIWCAEDEPQVSACLERRCRAVVRSSSIFSTSSDDRNFAWFSLLSTNITYSYIIQPVPRMNDSFVGPSILLLYAPCCPLCVVNANEGMQQRAASYKAFDDTVCRAAVIVYNKWSSVRSSVRPLIKPQIQTKTTNIYEGGIVSTTHIDKEYSLPV